jgi:dethiobiotin synthetase
VPGRLSPQAKRCYRKFMVLQSCSPHDHLKQSSRGPINPPGLFVIGTDTGVGKTRVAARIAAAMLRSGKRVGVYKPAASGCETIEGSLVSDDAVALWEAAGRPGDVSAVCPQRFLAPLAPHLAARAEGRTIDSQLLRDGRNYWLGRSGVIVVEGAGGLMSPLGENEFVADLAAEFGYPLVIVAPNRVGVINQVLQTLIAAKSYAGRLAVAGIVLNDIAPPAQRDPSAASNRSELERLCNSPVLAQLGYDADEFNPPVNWWPLANNRD